MAVDHGGIFAHDWGGGRRLSLHVPRLSSKDQATFLRLQHLDDPLADFQLVVPAEKVEEGSGIYHVHLSLQFV